MINRRKYCIANFKMHKTALEVAVYVEKLWSLGATLDSRIVLCPPFTSLDINGLGIKSNDYKHQEYQNAINRAIMLSRKGFPKLCAQNMCHADEGAFTGEISAKMIKDIGVQYVLLGHSERRQYFNETNETINLKMITALSSKNKLSPILCIGESLEERKRGSVKDTLTKQLSKCFKNIDTIPKSGYYNFFIAYEPVWAIGTGETATAGIIVDTHKMIRKILNDIGFDGEKISILYGGSVNRNNAKELIALEDVDGFLIGGASLDVEHFWNIYKFIEESV